MTQLAPSPPASLVPSESCSAAEWRTRVELAAAYRMLALSGITDLTYNHLSARVPDQPEHYLIKSEHLLFNEVTASSCRAQTWCADWRLRTLQADAPDYLN